MILLYDKSGLKKKAEQEGLTMHPPFSTVGR